MQNNVKSSKPAKEPFAKHVQVAILTKGIIALLLRVYSNQSPKDILNSEAFFIDEIGLKEHLSPTRANGLVSMVKQLKLYALAYQVKSS